MDYVDKILLGLLIFPLIAIVFTLPYAVYQYHKHGAVSKFRTLIIYSFILYMLIAYFQVILPLPEREKTIGSRWQEHLNLVPFRQIWLYWKGKAFNMKTFVAYAKSFSLWQLLLNILLTMPFGMYLKYYFKKSLLRTTFYSFLLSLFYELTQLSALYGIYPGPYRLADVEDLICNTLGGVAGFGVAHAFARILPDRDAIEVRCRQASTRVTGRRRIWALMFDYICVNLLYLFVTGIIWIFFPSWLDSFNGLLSISEVNFGSFFYVVLLVQVLATKGLTLGHATCRMILVSSDGSVARAGQYIKRYFFLWLFTEFPTVLAYILSKPKIGLIDNVGTAILAAISQIYIIWYLIRELFGKGNGLMPHDKLSKTVYMATEVPKK